MAQRKCDRPFLPEVRSRGLTIHRLPDRFGPPHSASEENQYNARSPLAFRAIERQRILLLGRSTFWCSPRAIVNPQILT
ncbi:hypothetical protein [Tychonema sp. LEGE 06208]|uniref:hypothetical protein n=1 Tax=Tychonema sp. LEGE 06208 TaxID=1828663 RepID=UPI0018819D89|nr:hypothetical protein [Tychonema sp. LEGE 06208]MBE9163551.1 hypothetical protein [Tychonema sp. LEGE 06208]